MWPLLARLPPCDDIRSFAVCATAPRRTHRRRWSGKLREDLLVFGKASRLGLGEDQCGVGHHVEYSAHAPHEFALDAVLVPDRGRQTGGPRKIVSLSAVRDADLHRLAFRLLRACRLPASCRALGTTNVEYSTDGGQVGDVGLCEGVSFVDDGLR